MQKRKLSKTAKRRRAVVFVIECAIVTVLIMAMALLVDLIVAKTTPALSGALMQAAEAVIG